jgi:hypothetical protein
LPAPHRALRAGLQLPPTPSGDRGSGAGGPVFPGGATGEGGDREGRGGQRAGPGPGASAKEALLSGGPSGCARLFDRARGLGAHGEAGRGGGDDRARSGGER